jgi:hypothetical protein
MKPDTQERAFLDKLRGVLKQDSDNLDQPVVLRLQRIRREALDNRERAGMRFWRVMRLPAAAMAMVAVIIFVTNLYVKSPREFSADYTIEDMEILASSEHLDMYIDLDFYAWLALEQSNAG